MIPEHLMRGEIECPVFHPTIEEFADFNGFMEKVKGDLERVGLCRIVPPKEWKWDRVPFEKLDERTIKTPIKQIVSGRTGVYSILNVEGKDMKVSKYREMAQKPGNAMPARCFEDDGVTVNLDKAQRAFWRGMTTTADCPQYGADVSGTVFEKAPVSWNVRKLDCVLRKSGAKVAGVTTPMLYFGMWRALFSIHNEDMNLFSINYIHSGAPKVWYAVPPSANSRLESLAQSLWPDDHIECKEFLRHKTKLISPMRLQQSGIPFTRTLHQEGEFMITMASAYHFGFNCGFNCAESVNFVTKSLLPSYLPYGRQAGNCACQPDAVHIDMDWFETDAFDVSDSSSSEHDSDSNSDSDDTDGSIAQVESKSKRSQQKEVNVFKRCEHPNSCKKFVQGNATLCEGHTATTRTSATAGKQGSSESGSGSGKSKTGVKRKASSTSSKKTKTKPTNTNTNTKKKGKADRHTDKLSTISNEPTQLGEMSTFKVRLLNGCTLKVIAPGKRKKIISCSNLQSPSAPHVEDFATMLGVMIGGAAAAVKGTGATNAVENFDSQAAASVHKQLLCGPNKPTMSRPENVMPVPENVVPARKVSSFEPVNAKTSANLTRRVGCENSGVVLDDARESSESGRRTPRTRRTTTSTAAAWRTKHGKFSMNNVHRGVATKSTKLENLVEHSI